MANQAVLEKLFSDEAYVKELAAMEAPEDVQASLNAKGADITLDEVKALGKAVSQKASGELSEDDLEDVAGGASFITNMVNMVYNHVNNVVTVIRSSRW